MTLPKPNHSHTSTASHTTSQPFSKTWPFVYICMRELSGPVGKKRKKKELEQHFRNLSLTLRMHVGNKASTKNLFFHLHLTFHRWWFHNHIFECAPSTNTDHILFFFFFTSQGFPSVSDLETTEKEVHVSGVSLDVLLCKPLVKTLTWILMESYRRLKEQQSKHW